MTSKERCDEIIRLIDDTLAAVRPLTPAVASPGRRSASRRPASRR